MFENHSDPDFRTFYKEYSARLINVEEIVASREDNFKLYNEAIDQLNAIHTTIESVSQQRDELRSLHREAQLHAQELEVR